jgi:hypothetical protein
MPRRVLIPLFFSVALLAFGCGESTAPSVRVTEASIVAARDRADFALERLTRARSRDELLARMDEGADAIEAAADDLEGIGANEDYADAVGLLVDSLRQLAFDVQATADQIRQPGFGDLLVDTRGLSFESWNKVNEALGDLRRKGIKVAPLERH